MVVPVEAYSGFKLDEKPLRFQLGERWLEVDEILDRWYDPDASYFRVRASDAAMYVLRHREPTDVWTLEAYRQA